MKPIRALSLIFVTSATACGGGAATGPTATAPKKAVSSHALALPGAPAEGAVFMDYIAYDRAHHRVWVPAGNTASVDVIDEATDQITRVEGFATREMERNGHKRVVGPSSVGVGGGLAFVGNRGDSSICAFDAEKLTKLGCLTLDSMPDGTVYVAPTKEVWVTTPRDKSIRVISAADPSKLAEVAKITFEGEPEGYAVDETGGRFYTNLEDADKTVQVDVKTRKVLATWAPDCGEGGPKGLAIDPKLHFLVVACPDHVKLMDAGHDGKVLAKVDTGAGVDNIDYVPARHEVYVGAARAATLTVAKVGDDGTLTTVATQPTAEGARNGVATDDGVVYLTLSPAGSVLIMAPGSPLPPSTPAAPAPETH
jgi:DNA-binding beta-propeller fold protein YncE